MTVEWIKRRINPTANWHGRHTSYPYDQPDVCTCMFERANPIIGTPRREWFACANADCDSEAKACGGWCTDCFIDVMPTAVTSQRGGLVEFVRPPTHKVWRAPQSVYVASSWRNTLQPTVVAMIAEMGIEVYDFKNPPGGTGFSWKQVQPPEVVANNFGVGQTIQPKGSDWEPVETYLEMVNHPIALKGFQSDFDAMLRADTFVMVLPCGKSAHLELGWATGAGKQTAVLLEDPVEPELMYHCADSMVTSLDELRLWLNGPT